MNGYGGEGTNGVNSLEAPKTITNAVTCIVEDGEGSPYIGRKRSGETGGGKSKQLNQNG